MLNRYQSDVEEIVGVRQRSDIWFSREPLTPENRDEIAYNAALTALAGIEPDAALREDLLQECMIKYLKYFPDFKAASIGQFAAWMGKIAKSTHSNHWRDQHRARRDVARNKFMSELTSQEKESGTREKISELVDDNDLSPLQHLIHQEALASVRDVIAACDPHGFLSQQMDGLSLEDIGQGIGKTRASVAGFLRKIRKSIKDIVESLAV